MEHLVKVSKMYNLESRTLRAAFSVQKEHMEGVAGRVRSLKSCDKQPAKSLAPCNPSRQLPKIGLENFNYT